MFRFTLTHTSGTEVLTRDPNGWGETVIRLRRDNHYHGLFKEYSQTLGFKCDGGGKDFIDNIYETLGVSEQITLLIEYRCGVEQYATLFNGLLNLKSYKRSNAGGLNVTNVNVELNEITTKVRNRDEMPVDLDAATSLEGTSLGASYAFANYALNLHSKVIKLTSRLENTAAQSAIDSVTASVAGYIGEIAFNVPLPVSSNEIKETETLTTTFNTTIGHANREAFRGSSSLPFHNTNSMPLPKVVPGTYSVDWDINGDYYDTVTAGTGARKTIGSPDNVISLDLWVGATLATATRYHIGDVAGYDTVTSAAHSDTFNFTGSTSFTVQDGDKVWLGWGCGFQIYGVGGGGVTVEFDFSYDANSYLNIEIDSTTPATTARAWCIFEAFARVSGYIADAANAFESDYLGRKNSAPTSYAANGCASFTAVTNGLSIRGFNNSSYDKPATFSLKELFDTTNAIWDIGLGIESGKVRVETKTYFYNSATTIFTAANVPAISMRIDLATLFNEVVVGYKKWESENFNGLDEFLTEFAFSIPQHAHKNKAESISPTIASGYAIELTRRKDKVNFETTDFKYDDEGFIICLNQSVDGSDIPTDLDVAEQNENFSSVSNILDAASAYNLRISPKRNLLRKLRTLTAGLTKTASATLKFQKAKGNATLLSTMTADGCNGDFTGASLDEDANLAWDNANIRDSAPIWLPEVYEFDYPVTYSQFKAIEANPRGVVAFTDQSETKKGFIVDFKYKVKTQVATFTLLRANV